MVDGGWCQRDRVLVVWSAGKQRLDDQKHKRHLKRLLDDLTNIQKRLNVRHYKRQAYVEQRLKTVQQRSHWAKGLVDIELTGGDEAISLQLRHPPLPVGARTGYGWLLPADLQHQASGCISALTISKGQETSKTLSHGQRTLAGPSALCTHRQRRIEGMVFITLWRF